MCRPNRFKRPPLPRLTSSALAPLARARFVRAFVAATMFALGQFAGFGAHVQADSPIARVDQVLADAWQQSGVRPAARATDYEYCRRVFLDLIGRIPSRAEVQQFARDRRSDKRARLVDRLLYDESYRQAYAEHWTTIWTNLLIGREPRRDRNRMVNRAGMRQYLHDVFLENRPYDQMVYELIAARGTNRPDRPDFNGAVNFLAGKLENRATQATADTARIFLGVQVQCTQCHNHPFNEWKQSQFWQFNAFFRQTTALRRFESGSRDVAFVELTDQDFAGEDRIGDAREARVYYELRNGRLQAAYPVFLDGTSIAPSGYLSDVNRREELARLVVRSPDLARALVNRMWGHFLGYGFTKPVDDMGPHNAPQFPELLDELADAFRHQSHDMKQLMRWITLSRPYTLTCRPAGRSTGDDPTTGSPPLFSHFYPRQMSAEQLYDSLLTATERESDDQGKEADERREWLRQFTVNLGTDDGGQATTFDGTITQTLMMFNGPLIRKAINHQPGTFLDSVISNDSLRFPRQVDQLFLAALSRKADTREQKMADQLLASYYGDTSLALQDLWWALLNSNEFLLIH